MFTLQCLAHGTANIHAPAAMQYASGCFVLFLAELGGWRACAAISQAVLRQALYVLPPRAGRPDFHACHGLLLSSGRGAGRKVWVTQRDGLSADSQLSVLQATRHPILAEQRVCLHGCVCDCTCLQACKCVATGQSSKLDTVRAIDADCLNGPNSTTWVHCTLE
jgi:hypothetical protein